MKRDRERSRDDAAQMRFEFEGEAAGRLRVGEGVLHPAAMGARASEALARLGAAAVAGRVRVIWNGRMRSAAGRVDLRRALISLNPRLVEFGVAEVERTLWHEVAHLLAFEGARGARIAPHGAEWRRACAALGIPGEAACHRLPLPRREVAKPHRYRCAACGLEVKRVRPLRARAACGACCRRHAQGRYDERFRLVKVRDAAEG